MNTANKIKKELKALGISVRVRTVKCKNLLTQVWIPFESHQIIPNEIRKIAVLSQYGVESLFETGVQNQEDIRYGTTGPKGFSIRESEAEKFFALLQKNVFLVWRN